MLYIFLFVFFLLMGSMIRSTSREQSESQEYNNYFDSEYVVHFAK